MTNVTSPALSLSPEATENLQTIVAVCTMTAEDHMRETGSSEPLPTTIALELKIVATKDPVTSEVTSEVLGISLPHPVGCPACKLGVCPTKPY